MVALGAFPIFGERIEALGIERVAWAPESAHALIEVDGTLELRPPGERGRPGIRAVVPVDRHAASGRGRPPLARAFGSRIHAVLDLTAGLGGDAYRLAAAGFRVRAWERHPAVFALLQSGWEEAVSSGRVPAELAQRLDFEWGDATAAWQTLEEGSVGAYLDPMYPAPRRRSALPKRPLQVLRELLEGDEEPIALLDEARERLSRVVVKRPHHAPPLADGVSHSLETKLVRYDVYLNPARAMEAADR